MSSHYAPWYRRVAHYDRGIVCGEMGTYFGLSFPIASLPHISWGCVPLGDQKLIPTLSFRCLSSCSLRKGYGGTCILASSWRRRASSQPPERSTSTCSRVSVRLSWTAHSMRRPYSIAWPPRIGFVLLGAGQCQGDNCKTSGIRSHAFLRSTGVFISCQERATQFNVGLADHFDLLTGLDATKMVD